MSRAVGRAPGDPDRAWRLRAGAATAATDAARAGVAIERMPSSWSAMAVSLASRTGRRRVGPRRRRDAGGRPEARAVAHDAREPLAAAHEHVLREALAEAGQEADAGEQGGLRRAGA